MTRLQPGDRHIRAVVRPEFPGGLTARGSWPCSACGEQFDVLWSHAVLYAEQDQAVPYAFMVCPECAAVLTPFRLCLDRQLLGSMGESPPAGDGARRTAKVVADHVTVVLAMRQAAPADVVELRAEDTHELADRLDSSREELVDSLRMLGVLRGIDVGHRPMQVPGAA